MKRISVLLMMLILSVSLFAFPASADEAYVGHVYCDNDHNLLAEFSVPIPAGYYNAFIVPAFCSPSDTEHFYFSCPIYVGESYPDSYSGDSNLYITLGDVYYDDLNDKVLFASNINAYVRAFDTFAEVEFLDSDGNGVSLDAVSDGLIVNLLFVPVSDDASGASGASNFLSGIVSGDILSGVLDNIVSLLPAVLVLIVAYIAIRKGISFIRDLLHAA